MTALCLRPEKKDRDPLTLAAEIAKHDDVDLRATVVDEQGFVRGWIHGDGDWRAQ